MDSSLKIEKGRELKQLDFLGDAFELKTTGLQVHGQPSFEACTSAFETLKGINGCVMWWIGDLLNFSERQYGETYAQMVDETDYSYQTLANAVWVSSRIEISRRRESLTWGHHAEIAALEPDEQDKMLEKAVQSQLSVHKLRQIVHKPHISFNSGENEWYTPSEYIEAARNVLGDIDLDPASTELANTVVQAKQIYTIEDNGLAQDWIGTIWLNPPYSTELIQKFMEKLQEQIFLGNVTSAIILVNNATETQWFLTLILLASAICFPIGRVRFWGIDGNVGAPLQGQAIVYIGDKTERFCEEFRHFGWLAIL